MLILVCVLSHWVGDISSLVYFQVLDGLKYLNIFVLDLKNLSGIAAILRFPLPELEEGDLGIEDEEDDSEMEFA